MTAWTNGELHQIGTAEELETVSLQSDGALRNPATIWVVPTAATSTSGPTTGAPPPGSAAQVGHEGRIQAGGVEKDVIFVEEDTPILTPVVIDFPLRGEWIAPNTPGTKVPSHGTDLFGERYAYDFVGIDPGSRRMRSYRPGPLRSLLLGVRLQDFFGWGQPIFSSTAGVVIRAEDGWPERNPVHIVRDSLVRLKNARTYNSKQTTDLRPLTGNFIIIETHDGYAVYAHAQTGSIIVSPGDKVIPGQRLANVGHSGNSTAPHLHFQLMDHPNPWKAQGILCSFREYEVFDHGAWRLVQNGIPKAADRIRKR